MARKSRKKESEEKWSLFEAEGAYAESLFCMAMGDMKGCIEAAERAYEYKPDYPPAVLTMGTIEYQRERPEEGARLFSTLFTMPDDTDDLCEIIDKAGDFLIQEKRYAEGLELYRVAVVKYPDRAVLYQGLGCCAAHEGLFDEAVDASKRAVELEPDRQTLTSDLGWSLFQAGRFEEAEVVLSRAVSMDSEDNLARENLRICQAAMKKKVASADAGVSGKKRRARKSS